MDTYNGTFTVYYWTFLLLYGVWMFTTWRWSYILRQVNDFTGRYHDDVAIHQWNFYLLHTSHVDYTVPSPMSPSSMCVYTKDNASLQSTYLIMLVLLVKLFLLMTHMCHAMSCCDMPLYNIACYRIWWHVSVLYAVICMYLGSNSYSVHCSTKALISYCVSWCPFGAPSSSSTVISLLPAFYLLLLLNLLYILFLKNVYKYI